MAMSISDEDYLALRARRRSHRSMSTNSVENADEKAATSAQLKSWLVTARLMYPNKFEIQYEAYAFAKDEGNVDEAAKCLNSLFVEFAKSDDAKVGQMWDEIDTIVDQLSLGRGLSDDSSFHAKVFANLPVDSQQRIMLASAFQSSDTLERSKKMLLALKTFPGLVKQHGGDDCLGYLIAACKSTNGSRPDESLLNHLVTEIGPFILAFGGLDVDPATLYEYMMVALDFAASFLSGPNSFKGWPALMASFEDAGSRLGWTLTRNFARLDAEDPAGMFQNLAAFHMARKNVAAAGGIDNDDSRQQIFYVSSLLFVKSLAEYLALLSDDEAMLVEAFVTHDDQHFHDEHGMLKRRRTSDDERRVPAVTHGHLGQSGPLVSAFLAAVRYFDFMQADLMLHNAFMAKVKPPENIINSFRVDVAMYVGYFREAVQNLRRLPPPPDAPVSTLCKFHVKMASLTYAIGDQQAMADQIIQAMGCLKTLANSKNQGLARRGRALKHPTVKMRHLHFLPFDRQSVTSYCSRLLIHVLKDRSLQPPTSATLDFALGHVIVLLQYCLPEEADLFYMLLHRIKMKEVFSYHSFCQHIVHIQVLEEFSHLVADANSPVTLDIVVASNGQPPSQGAGPSPSSGRRVGTRGSNRGEKNEVRTAIKRQVMRSHENLDDVIVDFISANRDSIIRCLL